MSRDPRERPGIDPETIAALLDGRLTGAEREAVLERIAADPDAADLFVETAVLRRDMEREGAEPGEAQPIRAKPRNRTVAWRWAVLPLAAAIAAILLVPGLRRSNIQPTELLDDQPWFAADADLAAVLGTGWDTPAWGVRGGDSGARDDALAFRAGVRLVDLEVAARANDAEAAARAAADLSLILGNVTAGAPAAERFNRIRDAIESGESYETEPGRDAIGRILADSFWLDLGLWAGQARLAALAGSAAFFQADGDAHRALQRLVDRATSQIPTDSESILPALQEIQQAFAGSAADTLAPAIDRLIEIAAAGT